MKYGPVKMPRNVEVKARVENIENLIKNAADLCDSPGTVIDQNDTFFLVDKGRLKLRVFKVRQSTFHIPKRIATNISCTIVGWTWGADFL